ncbi:Protein of unknown function [Pyronema omphalodes CBS 100304]|uniref:Uncharacterized protein n=1 Tax=Pyronema omphalodes (strain CBS 100304) TaxID=1076935 RepID=U4KW08_PYROM|nr:Protein of unknown function [Pyronema omphalodes CBS 100304]
MTNDLKEINLSPEELGRLPTEVLSAILEVKEQSSTTEDISPKKKEAVEVKKEPKKSCDGNLDTPGDLDTDNPKRLVLPPTAGKLKVEIEDSEEVAPGSSPVPQSPRSPEKAFPTPNDKRRGSSGMELRKRKASNAKHDEVDPVVDAGGSSAAKKGRTLRPRIVKSSSTPESKNRKATTARQDEANSASDASKGSAAEKGRTLRPRVAKNSSGSEVKKRNSE